MKSRLSFLTNVTTIATVIAVVVMTTAARSVSANPTTSLATSPTLASTTERPIHVLSVNVRYSTANDGENRWAVRKNRLLEVLKDENYDFICGQEVLLHPLAEWNQQVFISENFPTHAVLVRSRENTPFAGESTPVFYRKDRWRLDENEHGTYWLSDTPEVEGSITWEGQSNCPRVVTGGLFHELSPSGEPTGRLVYVFATHFDHIGDLARQKSVELVLQRLANRNRKDVPVILAGDFNCGEKSPAIRYLKGETVSLAGETRMPPMTLVDSFRVCHPDETDISTSNGFRAVVVDPGKPYPGTKIDYIMYTESSESGLRATGAEIIRKMVDGKFPSDHFPVRATFQF